MEVYKSKDGYVNKYVHDDGSETAIKTTPAVNSDGGVYSGVINKYNVFVSSSVGCPVGCKFCYLTVKKCPYSSIELDKIVSNVKEAIIVDNGIRDINDLFFKLSWMGMGDAFLNLEDMFWATLDIIRFVREEGYAVGLDGIDISTTMPVINRDIDYVSSLLPLFGDLALNPERDYSSRSIVRVFYSLHSAVEKTRRWMIPFTSPIEEALSYLFMLKQRGVNILLHHMFFEGINDSDEEIEALLDLLSLSELEDVEFRVLRFNKCTGTTFQESSKFDDIIKILYERHRNVKVQASPGSEVKAACGQFLLKKFLSGS